MFAGYNRRILINTYYVRLVGMCALKQHKGYLHVGSCKDVVCLAGKTFHCMILKERGKRARQKLGVERGEGKVW